MEHCILAVFKTNYRVTWFDIDAAQVVHHSDYFRIFQRAEEEFYEHLGLGSGYKYFAEHGIWLPRTKVFCRYKMPSRLGDTLEISLAIREIREKSVRYGFLVRKKGTDITIAEGYVVVVATEKRVGKPINIPSEIVEKLKAFKKNRLTHEVQ